MKESNFQFQDPYIISLEFKDNKNFDPENFENLKMNFDTNVSKSKTENKAFVSLSVTLGDEETSPFYIMIEMGAVFEWNDNFDKDTLEDLVSKNAPALLISYIRPVVASITSSSRFPSFNIPFVDFSSNA